MVYVLQFLASLTPVAFWGVVRGRRKQMSFGVAEAQDSACEKGKEESERWSPGIQNLS